LFSYYYDFSPETDDHRHSRLFPGGFFFPQSRILRPLASAMLSGRYTLAIATTTTTTTWSASSGLDLYQLLPPSPSLYCYDCVFILFFIFYRPSPATALSGGFRLAETNSHSNLPPAPHRLTYDNPPLTRTRAYACECARNVRAAVRRTLIYIYGVYAQHTLQSSTEFVFDINHRRKRSTPFHSSVRKLLLFFFSHFFQPPLYTSVVTSVWVSWRAQFGTIIITVYTKTV